MFISSTQGLSPFFLRSCFGPLLNPSASVQQCDFMLHLSVFATKRHCYWWMQYFCTCCLCSCCTIKLIQTWKNWKALKRLRSEKEQKMMSCVMLLAKRVHVSNEQKKKLGLTETIWYRTTEEVCLRGSWLSNKRRQWKGTCGALGAWSAFFLIQNRSFKGPVVQEWSLLIRLLNAVDTHTHTHFDAPSWES